MAAEVFDYATILGFHFSLLDIGGGFLGTRDSQDVFGRVAAGIRSSLEEHFSRYKDLRIIAEPGVCIIAYVQ